MDVQDSGDNGKEYHSSRSPMASAPHETESSNVTKEKATLRSFSTRKYSSEHAEERDTVPTTKTADTIKSNASQTPTEHAEERDIILTTKTIDSNRNNASHTPTEPKKSSTKSVVEMNSKSAKNPDASARENQESERVMQISETVRFKKDKYMLVVSTVTIILSMFAFLVSTLLGVLKIIATVLITASVAIGWFLRSVRAVNTAIIFMVFAAGTDVTIIAEAVQGHSTQKEAFLAILSSLMCIAVFIHLFIVTNDVRLRYKSEQSQVF